MRELVPTRTHKFSPGRPLFMTTRMRTRSDHSRSRYGLMDIAAEAPERLVLPAVVSLHSHAGGDP